MATTSPNEPLSPSQSPKLWRKGSTRRGRAASYLPPSISPEEAHEMGVNNVRRYLKSRTAYDAFPVSFRLIVLDTRLEVKKALQVFLNNSMFSGLMLRCLIGKLII